MPTENVSHRLIREPVTQVGHGTHDPVIAPPGIFLRHLHDQTFDFFLHPRTTCSPAKSRSVKFVGHEFSLPAENRIRVAVAARCSRASRPSR